MPAGAAGVPNPPLTDLVNMLSPANRYSYVFGGNTQVLDHVLVNDRARARVSRFQYARNNADFPESLRGDDTRPERISDHDMPVAYFVFFGAPVVTLAGDATMTVEVCQPFTDPGATAFDDTLGALPVAVSGSIDPNVPGTYTIHYTASNGFATTTVTRTIHVVDTTPPVLTLNGPAAVTIEAGTAWIDPGATAADTVRHRPDGRDSRQRQRQPARARRLRAHLLRVGRRQLLHATRTVTVVDSVAPWLSPVIAAPSYVHQSVGAPDGGRAGAVSVAGRRPDCPRARSASPAISRSSRTWTGRCSVPTTCASAPSERAGATASTRSRRPAVMRPATATSRSDTVTVRR